MRALRNDKTSRLESDIDTKEDALKIANDPEARELGDAYALLAHASMQASFYLGRV